MSDIHPNVKFYRRRKNEAGIRPEDIKGIDDISKLPFMTKQVLRDYYPSGTFAAPMNASPIRKPARSY